MNPDVRRDWVAALRSRDYVQRAGKLTHLDPDGDPTYCCLGVLCDLAVRAGVTTVRDVLGYWRVYGDDEQANYLPTEVREWAGLDTGDPLVPHGGVETRLSTLNDASVPFSWIAALIEEQL